MDRKEVHARLADFPLGGLRVFDHIGSTNDEALSWAAEGAPDFSLVVANEQTKGRGRNKRWWHTPPDAALAFSLILSPTVIPDPKFAPRLTALGALAVIEGLNRLTGLTAQIKWPNDVLLGGQKVAGILMEAVWLGEIAQNFVLGIGINIAPPSVPPPDRVAFPATSVETVYKRPVNRWILLRAILKAIHDLRPTIQSPAFLTAWEEHLAYRGVQVQVEQEGKTPFKGILQGLQDQGLLVLLTPNGTRQTFSAGEIRLRPGANPEDMPE